MAERLFTTARVFMRHRLRKEQILPSAAFARTSALEQVSLRSLGNAEYKAATPLYGERDQYKPSEMACIIGLMLLSPPAALIYLLGLPLTSCVFASALSLRYNLLVLCNVFKCGRLVPHQAGLGLVTCREHR